MRRPLPTDERPDVETRPFVPGADEEAWLAVNNRAFAATPSRAAGPSTRSACASDEPWFDPDGFRLHERDGRLAAFCWTKVHTDARSARSARST